MGVLLIPGFFLCPQEEIEEEKCIQNGFKLTVVYMNHV